MNDAEMDNAREVIMAKIAEALRIGERRGMMRAAEIAQRELDQMGDRQAWNGALTVKEAIERAAKEGENGT